MYYIGYRHRDKEEWKSSISIGGQTSFCNPIKANDKFRFLHNANTNRPDWKFLEFALFLSGNIINHVRCRIERNF